jgi:surface protein
MKQILEYIISKSSKRYVIKAEDDRIKLTVLVKEELERLGDNADLNHIDVSNVTNMHAIFEPVYTYQLYYNPDISQWNVSKVKDMSYMFKNCKEFNCDISSWDVSNVINMQSMFDNCKKFNQDISKWKVSNVENMNQMFFYCRSFNQNLSKWDVLNAIDNRNITQVFYNCSIKEEFKPELLR